MKHDEFYIGYMTDVPKSLRKWLLKMIGIVLIIIAGLAFFMATNQSPFYPSVYEFGNNEYFEGIIKEKPYPMLLVPRPGKSGALPGYSHYYLTAPGKFGASELTAGLDGKKVSLQGFLIYHDGQTMVKIVAGTLRQLDDATSGRAEVPSEIPSEEYLGRFTLQGEIVDTQCYFGIMNPGERKPHKACAIRCISGGVPPVLLVKNSDGLATYFLLVSEDGQMVNDRILPLVAEPVEITGEVVQFGDVYMLKAEPSAYRLFALTTSKCRYTSEIGDSSFVLRKY